MQGNHDLVRRACSVLSVLILLLLSGFAGAQAEDTEITELSELPDSPAWVEALGEEYGAEQLLVVAGVGQTTAMVSLHEKDESGCWRELMAVPGFIGRNGLGKTREGDGRTPVGVFYFNAAFGIADDPGCAIAYHKVTHDDYWSSDQREGFAYNRMVSIQDYPELNRSDSEHLEEYILEYQYCLSISYNEEGIPGAGSAIFLHCQGNTYYTGGCVAIPEAQMRTVMQTVREDCVVVIDSQEALNRRLRIFRGSAERSGDF